MSSAHFSADPSALLSQEQTLFERISLEQILPEQNSPENSPLKRKVQLGFERET
jgi:hypothetical protein